MSREFGGVAMFGSSGLPEKLEFPYLRGEGIPVHFDVHRSFHVSAEQAEASIARLYEHIDRLITAHEESER